MNLMLSLYVILSVLLSTLLLWAPSVAQETLVEDFYRVIETLPHDDTAFTQGLTFDGKTLYESTGLYGHSEIRHLDPQTGEVLKSSKLLSHYFGEGLAHYDNVHKEGRLIHIMWRSKIGFVYEASSLKKVQIFSFETRTGEGWGITYDPVHEEFIVSDGSSYLYYWDRHTLEEKRRVDVTEVNVDGHFSLHMIEYDSLNELEYVNGSILANIWKTDKIIKIDARTGIILQIYDFSALERPEGAGVFNGISITDKEDELWVTGKRWPKMYRVKLLA